MVDVPSLLTKEQAAKTLHLSPRSIQRLVERGELPFIDCGPNKILFDAQDLTNWIRSRRKVMSRSTRRVPLGGAR